MKTAEIYKNLTTPKSPPLNITPEEGLKAQQEAYEEQERQKWFQSPYTQRLMLWLENRKHHFNDLSLVAVRDIESSDSKNEYVVRQLTKVNTLNEIISYVTTGKI